MEITKNRVIVVLFSSQEKYVNKVLERFDMSHGKPILTTFGIQFKLSMSSTSDSIKDKLKVKEILYAQAVESLMYAIVCTRLDIAYSVVYVSRFLNCSSKIHRDVVKWILRYLKRYFRSWVII